MIDPQQRAVPRPRPALMIGGAALISFASTLLGIGGGAFMVPLLAAWAPMRLKKAVGTSLAVITAVVTVGMVVQVIRAPGDILWGEAGLLVCGAFAGAPVGRWLLRILPRQMFRYVFAVFLVVVAIRMFGLVPAATAIVGDYPHLSEWRTIAFALMTGFVAGVTSTLFGIGGGMVIVPALMVGYAELSDNFAIARATSLCAIVPISAWSTFLHWRRDNVRAALIPKLLPLAVVFAVTGVFAAYWISADFLTLLFGGLLLMMSIRIATQRVRAYVPGDDEPIATPTATLKPPGAADD
ncbi:MAG: sulfite exporter TauE/SafE family protein [Planctomycetes bacterium]|nr:sulfite exporter TauE/SafE family protein [Planctomycetota bacterium]